MDLDKAKSEALVESFKECLSGNNSPFAKSN